MAFLRSGKFFRFLSAGKNLVSFREYEGAHQLPATCTICSTKNFSSINATLPNQSLENSLKRLDQDVRRSGRISRRDLEEILDEIRTNKSATSSQSLLVIRCCGNLVPEELPEVRTKMVQDIWKTLSKLNVPMDISHYNALLRVYLENEYNFSPTEFLADLQSKGVEPNRVTYQRLISRYCQQGDIDGATQILEYMREKQLPVNENVFNALIMGHSYADDLESAAGTLSVMAQAGLEPSADTYTTLLCGFARKGDIESIIKYINECEMKEVYLVDKDFLEVIYNLAVNGHDDKVDEIILRLKKEQGYNQDAVNVILRLINQGQEPTAMKILKSMVRRTTSSGELTDTGSFLVKQLIKANRPVDQIISICNELEESRMNSRPLMVAIESALTMTNAEPAVALDLLKEGNKKGYEIRQHYFWPIFCRLTKESEIIGLMMTMQSEFKITPTNQTLREYVVPRLYKYGEDSIVQKLRSCGISTGTGASATAFAALEKHNLEKAADIMSSYDSYYNPGLFRKPLLNALQHTKDYNNYIRVVRQIHDNFHRHASFKQDEDEHDEVNAAAAGDGESSDVAQPNKLAHADVMGDIILDAAVYFRSNRVEVMRNILQVFVDEGISISNSKAEKIQDRIGDQMTTEFSLLLGKLTSGELEPIPNEKQRHQPAGGFNLDVNSLERLINRAEEKGGDNVKGLKRQLLVAAIRSRDIPKTEEVIEKLKAEGFVLTSGVHAQLIDLYASEDKLEEALNISKNIQSSDPEFQLDQVKVIKMIQAFVNAGRLEEGIAFLIENKPKDSNEEKAFNYNSSVWRLLSSLADKGMKDELYKLFDALVDNNFIIPNNNLLGPLIKVHLIQDDLSAVVDKFEELCQKYKATPCKNEISCRLIEAEDATNLQRITDLSTEIHGEVNSLYDLVFSFIECGRVRQARKILETPGLRSRPGRISNACERYLNEEMPTALEGLMQATKDLNYIDRADIYNSLLQTYIKENSTEKALGLWTTMQEEDEQPSDAFLAKLADFLKSQGETVPFHAPASSSIPQEDKIESMRDEKKKSTSKAAVKRDSSDKSPTYFEFRRALNSGDIDAIYKAKENLEPTDKITPIDQSLIIEALVKSGRIQEATKQTFDMLNENLHPLSRIFRFYLNSIAKVGDTKTIEEVGKFLTPEMKKLVSYDNRLCHSFVASGRSDEYLKLLDENIDNANTAEEISKIASEFPRGGVLGILEEKEGNVEKFEKIARKYAEKNIVGPINVVWTYYFIKNDAKAENIFKEFLVDTPRLMFQRVIQEGRDEQNESVIYRLIDVLRTTKVTEGAIGNAYSCLLDIHSAKEDAEACLKAIDASIKDVCLENVNRTALTRAKACVEKAGKKFPYTIPAKTSNKQDTSSSSSSSSSDDEVTAKEKS